MKVCRIIFLLTCHTIHTFLFFVSKTIQWDHFITAQCKSSIISNHCYCIKSQRYIILLRQIASFIIRYLHEAKSCNCWNSVGDNLSQRTDAVAIFLAPFFQFCVIKIKKTTLLKNLIWFSDCGLNFNWKWLNKKKKKWRIIFHESLLNLCYFHALKY